jgi:hypothetical protein
LPLVDTLRLINKADSLSHDNTAIKVHRTIFVPILTVFPSHKPEPLCLHAKLSDDVLKSLSLVEKLLNKSEMLFQELITDALKLVHPYPTPFQVAW